MKKHKALIVVENNSVPFDRRVWREAQTLRDAGWQVTVISPKAVQYSQGGTQIVGEDADFEVIADIAIYRYHLKAAEGGPLGFAYEYMTALIQTSRLVLKIWYERGFDVLQVCNPPDFFFPLGWICRLAHKGFIFDHHDLVPESVLQRWAGSKGAIILWVARLAERLTMLAAHTVISTNQSYREIALQRGGVSPEKVFVVRNGPQLRMLQRGASDESLRNGRHFLVGYLGIMGPQDGLELLLQAIRVIVMSLGRQDIQFLLVGDGALRPWLITKTQEWNLTHYVTLPGLAVTMEDWGRYLSSPDICVAPEPPTSFNQQSSITKIAEYMAMGQPIVAFDLKETRYTAQEAAYFVESTDPVDFALAIVRLLDDQKQRNRMSNYGLNRVRECLSWESQEQHLIQAYEVALRATHT